MNKKSLRTQKTPPATRKRVVAEIEAFMAEANLSEQEVADMLSVSQPTLHRWKTGESSAPSATAELLREKHEAWKRQQEQGRDEAKKQTGPEQLVTLIALLKRVISFLRAKPRVEEVEHAADLLEEHLRRMEGADMYEFARDARQFSDQEFEAFIDEFQAVKEAVDNAIRIARAERQP